MSQELRYKESPQYNRYSRDFVPGQLLNSTENSSFHRFTEEALKCLSSSLKKVMIQKPSRKTVLVPKLKSSLVHEYQIDITGKEETEKVKGLVTKDSATSVEEFKPFAAVQCEEKEAREIEAVNKQLWNKTLLEYSKEVNLKNLRPLEIGIFLLDFLDSSFLTSPHTLLSSDLIRDFQLTTKSTLLPEGEVEFVSKSPKDNIFWSFDPLYKSSKALELVRCNRDYSQLAMFPPTSGDPVMIECVELKFLLGSIEPFFCGIAIYDIDEGELQTNVQRISEWCYFNLNTENTGNNFYSNLAKCKHWIFRFLKKSPRYHLCIVVNRLLQQDQDASLKKYLSSKKPSSKEVEKMKNKVKTSMKRMSEHRSVFAYGLSPLFSKHGELLGQSLKINNLYPYKQTIPESEFEALLADKSSQNRKTFPSGCYFSFNTFDLKNLQKVPTRRLDPCLVPLRQPPAEKVLDIGSNCAREAVMLTPRMPIPNLAYEHFMYVQPLFVNLPKIKKLAVTVQLRFHDSRGSFTDEELMKDTPYELELVQKSNEDLFASKTCVKASSSDSTLPLKLLFSPGLRSKLVREVSTPVNYTTGKLYFNHPIKTLLPLGGNHQDVHFFFKFVRVHTSARSSKTVKELIGYSAMKIFDSTGKIINSGKQFYLKVESGKPKKGYLSKFDSANESGKSQFSFSTQFHSTVYPENKHIFNLFGVTQSVSMLYNTDKQGRFANEERLLMKQINDCVTQIPKKAGTIHMFPIMELFLSTIQVISKERSRSEFLLFMCKYLNKISDSSERDVNISKYIFNFVSDNRPRSNFELHSVAGKHSEEKLDEEKSSEHLFLVLLQTFSKTLMQQLNKFLNPPMNSDNQKETANLKLLMGWSWVIYEISKKAFYMYIHTETPDQEAITKYVEAISTLSQVLHTVISHWREGIPLKYVRQAGRSFGLFVADMIPFTDVATAVGWMKIFLEELTIEYRKNTAADQVKSAYRDTTLLGVFMDYIGIILDDRLCLKHLLSYGNSNLRREVKIRKRIVNKNPFILFLHQISFAIFSCSRPDSSRAVFITNIVPEVSPNFTGSNSMVIKTLSPLNNDESSFIEDENLMHISPLIVDSYITILSSLISTLSFDHIAFDEHTKYKADIRAAYLRKEEEKRLKREQEAAEAEKLKKLNFWEKKKIESHKKKKRSVSVDLTATMETEEAPQEEEEKFSLLEYVATLFIPYLGVIGRTSTPLFGIIRKDMRTEIGTTPLDIFADKAADCFALLKHGLLPEPTTKKKNQRYEKSPLTKHKQRSLLVIFLWVFQHANPEILEIWMDSLKSTNQLLLLRILTVFPFLFKLFNYPGYSGISANITSGGEEEEIILSEHMIRVFLGKEEQASVESLKQKIESLNMPVIVGRKTGGKRNWNPRNRQAGGFRKFGTMKRRDTGGFTKSQEISRVLKYSAQMNNHVMYLSAKILNLFITKYLTQDNLKTMLVTTGLNHIASKYVLLGFVQCFQAVFGFQLPNSLLNQYLKSFQHFIGLLFAHDIEGDPVFSHLLHPVAKKKVESPQVKHRRRGSSTHFIYPSQPVTFKKKKKKRKIRESIMFPRRYSSFLRDSTESTSPSKHHHSSEKRVLTPRQDLSESFEFVNAKEPNELTTRPSFEELANNLKIMKWFDRSVKTIVKKIFVYLSFGSREIRLESIKAFYLLFQLHFLNIIGPLAQFRDAATSSFVELLKELKGNSPKYLQESLLSMMKFILTNDISNFSSEEIESSFRSTLYDLLHRLISVYKDSERLKQIRNSPEFHDLDPCISQELLVKISRSYDHIPKLKLEFLRNLSDFHAANSYFAESARASLTCAELLDAEIIPAEKINEKQFQIQMKRIAFLFGKDIVFDNSDTMSEIVSFYTDLAVSYYENAVVLLNKADYYEAVHQVVHKKLIPTYYKEQNWPKVAELYDLLSKVFTKLQTEEKARFLGTYFQVQFFGSVFQGRSEKTYVYKFPGACSLGQVKSFLTTSYSIKTKKLIGCFSASTDVTKDELKQAFTKYGGMLQIILVKPLKNNGCEKSMFSNSRRLWISNHSDVVQFHYSKKSETMMQKESVYTVSVECPFPALTSRQEVCETEVQHFSELQTYIRSVKNLTSKFLSRIRSYENDPTSVDLYELETFLSSHVLLQVNGSIDEKSLTFFQKHAELGLQQLGKLQEAILEFADKCEFLIQIHLELIDKIPKTLDKKKMIEEQMLLNRELSKRYSIIKFQLNKLSLF